MADPRLLTDEMLSAAHGDTCRGTEGPKSECPGCALLGHIEAMDDRHEALVAAVRRQIAAWRGEQKRLDTHGIDSDRGGCAKDLEAVLKSILAEFSATPPEPKP